MNMKSLFICLLIIALVASSAQALMIKKTQNHKKSIHMAKTFAMGIQHRMCDTLHLQTDDSTDGFPGGEQMPDFLVDFLNFAMGDVDIMNSIINNQSLSQKSTDKIKQFFLENKSFNDMMLQIFQSPDAPVCMRNLEEAQQRKLVTIAINELNFLEVLNGTKSSKVDAATEKKIQNAIANDPELGDDVAQCYKDNAESFGKVA